MFGQNTSAPTFGQQSAFNSTTTPFGQIGNTATQPSTSLFGQTNPQTSSLFGSSLTQPTATNSLFGTPQTQQTQSAFGGQSTFGTSSLFGNTATQPQQQQQQQTSIFGNTNRFSVGSTTTFGANTALGTAMNVPTGTTIKFQPHNSTDSVLKNGHSQSTTINIRLQCITCMREYEMKSLEELRMEDYAANRKGPQQQNLFGTSTMNSGTFSSGITNTGFGQTSSNSLFSTQKPFGTGIAPTTTATTNLFSTGLSSTGTTSGGLFGQTGTNTTFGQPTDNKSTLSFFNNQSSSTAPAMTSFGFSQQNSLTGSTASTSLFGNPGTTTNSGGSLFGQTQNSLTQNKPMFGSSLTSAFGQTQPQQTSSTNMFGSSNVGQTGTGMFGQTSQQPSLFSTNQSTLNKTSFAFPQTSGLSGTSTFNPSTSNSNIFSGNSSNVFGSTSNTSGSLFGNTNTLGSSSFGGFGTGTSQPFQSSGSGFNFSLGGSSAFGASNTGTTNTFNTGGLSSGGMFGTGLQSSNQFGQQQSLNTGSTAPNAGTAPITVNTDQIIIRLQTLPYGTLPSSLSEMSSMSGQTKTKFTTDPKTLNQYKINAKQQAESVKVQRTPVTAKPTTLLFDGLDDESPENLKTAADIFQPRDNIKKLLLNKSSSSANNSLTKTPIFMKNSAPEKSSNIFNKENESPLQNNSSSNSGSLLFNKDNINSSLDNTMAYMDKLGGDTGVVDLNKTKTLNKDIVKNMNTNSTSIGVAGGLSTPEKSFTFGPLNFSSPSLGSNSDHSIHSPLGTTNPNYVPPKCGVILTRADYYTIPSLEECDQFYNPNDDTCIVDSFTVGRLDYGSIYWKGPLNIKGINLDEIVHIRRKEVIVYPDDDQKPPISEGLNRPAQITLDQVWPIDKNTKESIKDVERLRMMKYAEKLERATVKLDAVFKEYRPETGSWVFVVKHFSKYGLDAEDEDVEIVDAKDSNKKSQQQPPIQPMKSQTQVKLTYDMFNNLQQKNNNVHLNGTDYSSERILNGSGQYANLDSFQDVADEQVLNNNKIPFNFKFNDASLDQNKFVFKADYMDHQQNQSIFSKTNQMKEDEYSVMRSALFFDDVEAESISKKCKNLSFTSNQKLSAINLIENQMCGSMVGSQQHQSAATLFPDKFKTTLPKKRRLVFEQQQPSTHKADAYSFCYSRFPKARFANGSNKFCFYVGDKVLVFDVDLVHLLDNSQTNQASPIEKLEKHLNEHSTIVDKRNESMTIAPLIKTNSYCLNTKNDQQMNSLIEALYGELSEKGDYARHQERVRRILNWLFQYNKTLPVPDNSYRRIIHFLTTNELEFAVTECINSRMPRLSYLVACGPFGKKELLFSQLNLWKRSEADAFINNDLLKIYVILAGLSLWNLSTHKVVQPLEGLEWTQQMVLLMLYKTRGDEIIGTNLVRAAIEELTVMPNVVEYHLLAQHQPWVAITSAKNQMDAWFLQESLQSYNVINSQDVIMNRCDSINLFMASQVRDLRWSLFFALHIKNDHLRCSITKELLSRNAAQLLAEPNSNGVGGGQELCQFLKQKYLIDERWINEAKSYWTQTIENRRMINRNLLEIENNQHQANGDNDDGGNHNHQADLITNKDYKEILQLVLEKLRSHQHQKLLPTGKKFQFLNNNNNNNKQQPQNFNKRIESISS